MKNYTYVSDYAVVVIHANTEEEAHKELINTVKNPGNFGLESEEEI